MLNHRLSEIFGDMADVMEILGEDRFRINTYRKVARVIGDCPDDIAVIAVEGRLASLAGIGKSSAAKINEYVNLGSITVHRELLAKIPAGLLELLKVPGMGPKGLATVWKQLGVSSLADLSRAIDDGSLEGLGGFGAKKAQSLKRGIEFVQSARGRLLLSEALAIAERLIEQLGAVTITGSLRRRRQTAGDIDLLARSDPADNIAKSLTELTGIQQVLAAGKTKTSVLFGASDIRNDPVQVDLRVVPAASFGAAIQYFTGSSAHNVRLRELAAKKGLKLNEYGLFDGDSRIAGESEEDIYKKLSLQYVPPPMREDSGEIEAAIEDNLPELVQIGDIQGDLHMHSPASDGRVEIDQLVSAAKEAGYKYIAITDHSRSSVIANGLDDRRLVENIARIRAINESLKDFTVLASAEVDILADGSLDYPDELLAELDFVIASVHSGMTGERARLTSRVIRAIENPYVDCIGHPTGRLINIRSAMELDISAIVSATAECDTALELNAHPLRLDLCDIHCRMAVERGVKICINTDSHDLAGFGNMRYGIGTAQRGWVCKGDVLNCLSARQILAWVGQKRPK